MLSDGTIVRGVRTVGRDKEANKSSTLKVKTFIMAFIIDFFTNKQQ